MKIHQEQLIDVNKLVFDENNARKHNKKNLQAIRTSIKRFGQIEPLLVQQDTNIVIGGNARLEIMLELGYQKVLVKLIDCTQKEFSAIAIALNRAGELASWNKDRLTQLLDEVNDDLFSKDLGFNFDIDLPDEDTEDLEPEKQHTCPNCGFDF